MDESCVPSFILQMWNAQQGNASNGMPSSALNPTQAPTPSDQPGPSARAPGPVKVEGDGAHCPPVSTAIPAAEKRDSSVETVPFLPNQLHFSSEIDKTKSSTPNSTKNPNPKPVATTTNGTSKDHKAPPKVNKPELKKQPPTKQQRQQLGKEVVKAVSQKQQPKPDTSKKQATQPQRQGDKEQDKEVSHAAKAPNTAQPKLEKPISSSEPQRPRQQQQQKQPSKRRSISPKPLPETQRSRQTVQPSRGRSPSPRPSPQRHRRQERQQSPRTRSPSPRPLTEPQRRGRQPSRRTSPPAKPATRPPPIQRAPLKVHAPAKHPQQAAWKKSPPPKAAKLNTSSSLEKQPVVPVKVKQQQQQQKEVMVESKLNPKAQVFTTQPPWLKPKPAPGATQDPSFTQMSSFVPGSSTLVGLPATQHAQQDQKREGSLSRVSTESGLARIAALEKSLQGIEQKLEKKQKAIIPKDVKGRKLVVFDTCALMTYFDACTKWWDILVESENESLGILVPLEVVNELDRNKKKKETQTQAVRASRFLQTACKHRTLYRGQREEEISRTNGEQRRRGDDSILDCMLLFQQAGASVELITPDRNFTVKAKHHKFIVVGPLNAEFRLVLLLGQYGSGDGDGTVRNAVEHEEPVAVSHSVLQQQQRQQEQQVVAMMPSPQQHAVFHPQQGFNAHPHQRQQQAALQQQQQQQQPQVCFMMPHQEVVVDPRLLQLGRQLMANEAALQQQSAHIHMTEQQLRHQLQHPQNTQYQHHPQHQQMVMTNNQMQQQQQQQPHHQQDVLSNHMLHHQQQVQPPQFIPTFTIAQQPPTGQMQQQHQQQSQAVQMQMQMPRQRAQVIMMQQQHHQQQMRQRQHLEPPPGFEPPQPIFHVYNN